MEDGLGEPQTNVGSRGQTYVLILVLMEDGLGVNQPSKPKSVMKKVLILVLMEDGLGDIIIFPITVKELES